MKNQTFGIITIIGIIGIELEMNGILRTKAAQVIAEHFGTHPSQPEGGCYHTQTIGAYVKSLSTLSAAITAAGIYGSTISSYRTSLDGVTYTAASFTASKKLSAAGDMTMTVTVIDSRGRTATYTNTFNPGDHRQPDLHRHLPYAGSPVRAV